MSFSERNAACFGYRTAAWETLELPSPMVSGRWRGREPNKATRRIGHSSCRTGTAVRTVVSARRTLWITG